MTTKITISPSGEIQFHSLTPISNLHLDLVGMQFMTTVGWELLGAASHAHYSGHEHKGLTQWGYFRSRPGEQQMLNQKLNRLQALR